MPTEVLWRLQTPDTRLRSVTASRSRCAPLTDGAAAGIWRAETAASGQNGGDVAPKCFYGMTYHNRVVLWHVRRGGTRLRGVAPLTDGAAGGTWRGETDASGLHTEGILLWVWPGCCSKVFLWADLTQPGGEFYCSKPVCLKSKG